MKLFGGMKKSNYTSIERFIALSLALLLNALFLSYVNAASLSTLSDTMSRLKVSEDSNHTIVFTTPSGVEAGQNFIITFPSDFSTTSVDYTDIDILDDATPLTLAGTPSGSTWGAAFGGTGNRTLTVTSGTGTISTSSVITVTIGTNASGGDQAINNPTTNGTKVITLAVDNSGTANDDSGSIAIVIVTDDQVVLSATVDPSITFSLSANTSGFGTLLPGVVDTAGTVITLSVGTNGNGGYIITVRDAGNGSNPGLYSVAASSIIGSADSSYNATADLSSAPTGYGMQAACTAGCTTGTDVNSDYRQGSDVVGAFTIANKNVVTYSSATSSDHTITNTYKAKSSASTKAGTYTDTLTYIATATF